MKSRKHLFLYAAGALVVVMAVALMVSSRAGRTRSYFNAYRAAYTHSPGAVRSLLALADFTMRPVFETFGTFEPVWQQLQPGVKMRLDPYDLVSRTILETGTWEPESTQSIAEHLSPNATFVDIGAHIGYYSVKAIGLVGPSGHVISVEPNPQTLPKLRGNVAASEGQNVRVWPVACAASESTLQLFAAPGNNTGESSLSKTNASQEGAATVAYSVRAMPLDAIVKESQVDRVDVVKIDVEGAEFEVLKGAAHTLDEFHPVLVIEIEAEQLKSMGTSVDEVKRFLASHGYSTGRRVDHANYEFVADKSAARARVQ